MKPRRNWLYVSASLALAILVPCTAFSQSSKKQSDPIVFVVMDPLAKELACACVKGYGQRDYRKLTAHLQAELKQSVSIEFSDDLADTLQLINAGKEIIVVGEPWQIAHGAKIAGLKCRPVCELSGLNGETTVTGSFIVRSDDPAKELKDLRGRPIFLGLPNADEKQSAALAALRDAGVEIPEKIDPHPTFNDAALDVLDSSSSPAPVAVIPSYGLRLLEGCGTVRPGSLKVIGTTKESPFLQVFVADAISPDKREKILKALLGINKNSTLLKAMESRDGFKPLKNAKDTNSAADVRRDWPDWRGPNRDGHVPRLPSRLPQTAKLIWRKAAMTGGLAGLSVSDGRLISAERDFDEQHDVYRCLDANTGELLWRQQFPAAGQLDYGQSPRATPVIHNGRAYLLGAFGHLCCVDLRDGKKIWERRLPEEFNAELPTWGMCSTPLLVDDLLIVNPGATNASLAALDCATGRTRWTTPGLPAAYSTFIYGTFGGRAQIIGYDEQSLGGWDVNSGERLWKLVPTSSGDFNVPTPVAVNGGIVVSTENNGTRFYRFDDAGRIIPEPAGEFAALAPDTASPVVTCDRVFGAHNGVQCLDVRNGLKPLWRREVKNLGDHATLIADAERLLVVTLRGELLLFDARSTDGAILSRLQLFTDEVEVYSHPALVGTRLYARGGSSIICVDLTVD